MKKQQGFTLIELMIVVAIIGVLSAIAVPAYKDYVAKSEMASAMATMKALITPAELVIQEEGEISGGVTTLNIAADANPLGEIDVADNGLGLTFEFKSGSLDTKKLTFNRDADEGWNCLADKGMPPVDGCKEDTTKPKP
ncbi:Fimbrial protein precursor [Photobacterium piscicola]|uniref:Fimbrial protein n=1 Tax=Photobacterium piscicola TaxID=1378299 RepID=A0A1T5I365_9GAMM|nr:pilin [Photobacterium piscicola]SKC33335.1 Fimbrial protein precursor [Photobacterium piscicola]